jgi:hypothetical protein
MNTAKAAMRSTLHPLVLSGIGAAVIAAAGLVAACGGESGDGNALSGDPGQASDGGVAEAASPRIFMPTDPSDAGTEAAAPVVAQDVFARAVTYQAPKPTLTAGQIHQDKGVNPGQPAHQSCISGQCHGNGDAKPFAFGVTVCGEPSCQSGAEGVEVRVMGSDGVVFSAFTDADGNAWFDDNGKLKFPAYAGVQTQATTKLMNMLVPDGAYTGSCNSNGCHAANPQGLPPDASLPNVALWATPDPKPTPKP